jgi:hypothetical protein
LKEALYLSELERYVTTLEESGEVVKLKRNIYSQQIYTLTYTQNVHKDFYGNIAIAKQTNKQNKTWKQ